MTARRVNFRVLLQKAWRYFAAWQIRAVIRRGFIVATSRNNKEYPVSLPFLSNKSHAAYSNVYLSSIDTRLLISFIKIKLPRIDYSYLLDYIYM